MRLPEKASASLGVAEADHGLAGARIAGTLAAQAILVPAAALIAALAGRI